MDFFGTTARRSGSAVGQNSLLPLGSAEGEKISLALVRNLLRPRVAVQFPEFSQFSQFRLSLSLSQRPCYVAWRCQQLTRSLPSAHADSDMPCPARRRLEAHACTAYGLDSNQVCRSFRSVSPSFVRRDLHFVFALLPLSPLSLSDSLSSPSASLFVCLEQCIAEAKYRLPAATVQCGVHSSADNIVVRHEGLFLSPRLTYSHTPDHPILIGSAFL